MKNDDLARNPEDFDLELIQIERASIKKGGFKEFIKRAWHIIEPDELVWEEHLTLMADHLEGLYRGEMSDLCCNVPPGTSKSRIFSIFFNAWVWTMDPTRKFMCVCGSKELATYLAGEAFRLIMSNWYRERWPKVRIIDGDQASVADFKTTAGGFRQSTMFGGGGVTGRHVNFIIVDDPHKIDDLEGDPDSVKRVLAHAWTLFTSKISNRRANAGTRRRAVVMQRLHQDDVAGRFMRLPGTVSLILPMEFDPKRAHRSKWGNDKRTVEGELLAPVRFSAEVVESDRAEYTKRAFASQMQQLPAPDDGILFERRFFQNRWHVLPPKLLMYISVDANLKDRKDSDYCAIQVWGVHGGQLYLVDKAKGKWSFNDALKWVKNMREKWPSARAILVEDKANGTAIIDSLKEKYSGVIAINPEGGKWARAEAHIDVFEAGDVLIPYHAGWADEYVDELVTFPNGSFDDDVDATTQFLCWYLKKGKRKNKFAKAMTNARHGYDFR